MINRFKYLTILALFIVGCSIQIVDETEEQIEFCYSFIENP